MPLFTFVQPTAATGFVTRTTGTSSSDTYAFTLDSRVTPPPNGLWHITDRDSAVDIFQFNIVLDSAGRFRGPAPYTAQIVEFNNLTGLPGLTTSSIWSFSDLRTNPLQVRMDGFNPLQDTVNINVFNSSNQLISRGEFFGFYQSAGTSQEFDIVGSTSVRNFTIAQERWFDSPLSNSSSDTNLVIDVSKVTSELSSTLQNFSSVQGFSALNSYNSIDVIFDDDAFVGGATALNLSAVPTLSKFQFTLSATAQANQGITETNDGWWDNVYYSNDGVNSSGNPTFVTDGNTLQSLTLNWNASGTTVNRSLTNNTSFTDTYTGIENFSLTSGNDTINIDTRNLPGGYANVSALGGDDLYRIQTSGTGSSFNGVNISFGTPWYDHELNGVYGNFTGRSISASNQSDVSRFIVPSGAVASRLDGAINQDGSAVARVYDAFAGYDTVEFNSNADIFDFQVTGSKFNDRFLVSDLGLSGAINQFTLRGTAGNDILRIVDQTAGDVSIPDADRINIVADYAWAKNDIQDPVTGQDISALQLKVYSGVVQKGDRGIYGTDRIQRESSAIIGSEEYILNEQANYLEWTVSSQAKQLVFHLGNGADRAYIKPLLNDVNNVMMVDFSSWMGGDGAADILEIDLKGIIAQIPDQRVSTETKVVLTGVEAIDQIRFVNPSTGGMTRAAYDDGNSGTSNDAQMGWTFTRTQTSGSNTYTHKVNVLIEDSSITALQANPITVNARTVYDYPTYAMTANADNAILFEDSGLNTFYDFQAGNDFVLLRDGNLDVVLGAGDDFAGVSGNVGEAIVIGGTGNDTIGLQGRIGTNGGASDWVFTTMDVATARTVFAEKYALNPAANPFQIELSASGMEVVTVAQRYEGGTTWNLVTKKYTGVGDVVQTVYLQAENVSSADSGEVTVDSLYGSRDFSATASVAGTFSYLGRRGTEDSLTITLSDANSLATAMSNINAWFVTTNGTLASLNGSVLNGSHLSTITTGAMGVTGLTGATYNLVDIEQITLRGGAESVTIRLAGANGYGSVSEAVSAADYKDVIFVAKTIESPGFANPNLLNSIANQTTIDIPAGLGIVFEPVTASTTYRVNITDQMVADAPMNADRLVYLLGRQNVDVNGSVLSDMIIGNQGNNIIYGAGGNDVIYGGGGNDTMFGQAGNDLLIGSAGNDFLNGGTGDDTLMTYGSKRTNATTADRTNMIGGSGDDDFIFLGGQGNHVMYGGSGDDGYKIMPGWENGLNRVGTTAQQRDINGVGNVLDYSTTADFIVGRSLGTGSAENYLTSVNLTFNQLVSPPNPIGSSYVATTFTNGTTMQANADNFTISSQTNLGSLLEDYGLMNDVTEYRLHQAA